MNTKNRLLAIAVSAASVAATSGAAMATAQFTSVAGPAAGEAGHATILSTIYGGTWSKASNGLDYRSSSGLTAARLMDAGSPTPTSLTTGVTGTDNAWTGPSVSTITAEAKYAADNSVFGYYDDSSTDHSFHQIFNTSNLNHGASVSLPGQFRFALKDLSTNTIVTSRSQDNVGVGSYNCNTYDQLVTYKVMCGGVCQYVLFWEDRKMGQNSDRDFNDAVVVLNCRTTVPAPAGAGALALAGVGLGLRRRRSIA